MTLSLIASPRYSRLPAVQLVGTSTTSGPSPVPGNSPVTVYRVHGDGTEHPVLTEAGPRFIGGTWVGFDYHLPYNTVVTYRVEAAGFSATSNPIQVMSERAWLVHPSVPELSVLIDTVVEISSRTTGSRSTRFEPVGGRAIFLSDGYRDGVAGTLTIRQADESELRRLFADDSVILINTPARPGWDLDWLWVQPGQVQYENPAGTIYYQKRLVSIPFEEAADPDYDLLPIWSSGDAQTYWGAAGVNAAGVVSRYATAMDLQTDTRL